MLVLQKALQRRSSSCSTHRHLRSKQLWLDPQDHNLLVHPQSWFDLVCLSRHYSRNQHTHCNVLAEGAVGIVEGDEDIEHGSSLMLCSVCNEKRSRLKCSRLKRSRSQVAARRSVFSLRSSLQIYKFHTSGITRNLNWTRDWTSSSYLRRDGSMLQQPSFMQ